MGQLFWVVALAVVFIVGGAGLFSGGRLADASRGRAIVMPVSVILVGLSGVLLMIIALVSTATLK